jgi:hypothetical protein
MFRTASIEEVLADKKKMTDYICERMKEEGMEITLADGPEGGPVWARLYSAWDDEYGWDLQFDTNEPDWVCPEEIYRHFRQKDMTCLEWNQEVFWELYSTDPHSAIVEGQPAHDQRTCDTPFWDADLGKLWVGDTLIKAYREEAENQRLVLAAFQGQHWRHRIDDPIPGKQCERLSRAKRRLRDTITGINADHITAGVIRFRGDGTGRGIIWEPCE